MNPVPPQAPVAAPRPANRLGRETSPYLLQHAHNPVDWYPWGEEAFARARVQDMPILLSVGYSACHWCHVMERECFENESIAAVMNAHFVSIKVDREERPDVDEIYMAAVQAMAGSGGWPMTVFLTPDLRPFYGGTYFPPDDRYGRPGFPRVLEAISSHYRGRRDHVEDQAVKLTAFLAQNADPLAGGEPLSPEMIASAARQLCDAHDDRYGGFGQSGPKFPNSAGLSLLLRHWHDSGDDKALRVAVHTLERMARGGIYDQLGGGFHRYSVDERWLVPHFEKMLYDNALLVPVYLEAFQLTSRERFRSVARASLDYVLREMTAPAGGYCATQDADSEGEEGRFFVWTPEQVEAVLGAGDAADHLCRFYGVTPQGNLEGSGASVLHVEFEEDEAAVQLGVDPDRLRGGIAAGRQALFAARAERVPPGRDDKVLVSWNGLMISAMARGSQVLGDERYLRSAESAARFLLEAVVVDGALRHGFKDGRAPIAAFQDDYACLTNGLVDLYEATFDPQWLRSARDLAHEMVRRFWDGAGRGGFFFADAGRTDLVVRSKNPFDGATPSGNSVAVTACLRLAALTGDDALLSCAQGTLRAYADLMAQSPSACPFMLCALHRFVRGPCEVTVVGADDARRSFLERVHSHYLPNRVLAGAKGNGQAGAASELVPALRERLAAADGGARAYVCRDSVCSAPAAEPEQLARLLSPLVRRVG